MISRGHLELKIESVWILIPAPDGCLEMESAKLLEMAVFSLARKCHQESPYRHHHLFLKEPKHLMPLQLAEGHDLRNLGSRSQHYSQSQCRQGIYSIEIY